MHKIGQLLVNAVHVNVKYYFTFPISRLHRSYPATMTKFGNTGLRFRASKEATKTFSNSLITQLCESSTQRCARYLNQSFVRRVQLQDQEDRARYR